MRRLPYWMLGLAITAGSATAAEPARLDFDRQIAPLLTQHCLDCHSGPKPKGRLDLTRRQKALDGAKDGPAIVPGKPDDSTIWQQIDAGRMPPKKKLSATEQALIKDWIAAGAAWGTDPIDPFRITTSHRAGADWWSLQAVARPAVPAVADASWVRNPVDAFVRARLDAKKLAPSPAAERRVLIRRVTFDLIGLPPVPADVEAFVNDPAPDAYEKVVDRLLTSPHYGERWARHWLDVVRFGESNGFERDLPRPNAWPYRDWVIHALNQDMPYDEFVRWQLAGDVLRPGDPAALRAAGFLVAGPHDTVVPASERMKQTMRLDELEDLIGTVGQAFLGLTVNCARCHDHKFDPISQKEYYQIAAALAGAGHGERDAGGTKLYTVMPTQPPVMHVLNRGNVTDPGEVVAPGGIRAVSRLPASFDLPRDAPEGKRRLRLAEWLTDDRQPLFARVIVNRLWHYHFGAGLVENTSDLGFNGGVPSHPELLDWLASELVRERWSLKALHRLLVTSATYRQGSLARPEAVRIDANNRLLWRHSPQRLEAEAVRDAMLVVAGRLDPAVGGKGYQDFRSYFFKGTQFYDPVEQVGPAFYRRTVYRMGARGGRNPLLDVFDCPDPSTTTPRRAVTTTPLQALALANNAAVLHLADQLAARLVQDCGADVERQLQRAYELAYARKPAAAELAAARAFVGRHGLTPFCRVLFNTNEFIYLD